MPRLFQEEREVGPAEPRAVVLVVSGRVQGVGFRWFTEREALRHGVKGYVRNLDDGGVEIWAQADERTLALFQAAVERGPRASRVDGVAARPVPVDESLSSFRVRF